MMGDYENSVRFHSIAVLLSRASEDAGGMLPVYIKRLGWDFEKYEPSFPLGEVKENPVALLSYTPLSIKSNADVRRVFFREMIRPHAISGRHYVLRSQLRTDDKASVLKSR